MRKIGLLLFLFLLHSSGSIGQIYLNQFTGTATCPTQGNVPIMATNSTGSQVTRSTLTCIALVNAFSSTTLNNTSTISNSSYIEFSATANSGFQLNVTSLSFFRQGSNAAPNQIEVRYSTDGFITSTSWGTAPNTPTGGSVITWDFADFSTTTGGTITFRIYPYGTTRCDLTTPSLTSGTFRVDDVTINGTVTSSCTPPADPSGSITPAANPACGSTTLNFSNASADIYWQTAVNGTSTSNPTTTDLTVSSSGTYYARRFDGTCWSTNAVASAAITVNTAPSITGQPSSPAAVCGSYSGDLSVTATGTNLSYQWQYSADGISGWASVANNIPNTGVTYTNATLATLSIAGLTQTGYYRCVVSNGGCPSAASNVATVTVNSISSTPTAIAGTSITSNGFTANWNTVSGATGYYVDVYTVGTTNDNLVSWNFPNNPDNATADGGITANLTQTITTNSTGAVSYIPIGTPASTTSIAISSGWNSGSLSKFWEVSFTTAGYENIRFSSLQRSSNTGPRDFKVQYKIGASGTYTDVPGGSVTVANNWTTGQLTNIALPSACNNQSSVYLRWIMTSNTGVNSSPVDVAGSSAIDNILVEGTLQKVYVNGFQNFFTTDNFLEVTGLSGSTTYYYVVRSYNGNCTSGNSNEIAVTTAPPCVPSATISSFLPTSGPAGTLVTITGTGFTGATAVKFGNTNATTFTVVNSTTIIAEVPANTPTGNIRVTVSSCDAVSASNFTFLSQAGSCGTSGSTASDLFISEVYDAEFGSLSYIEIFNATGVSVNLSSYVVRVYTTSSTFTDYSLSGTLANNSVFVLSFGTSAVTCSSVTVNQSDPSGSGFNGNDRIYLRKAGVNIDYVPNPNYGGSADPGFSQSRLPSAIAPSTTYNATDWTISTTESCSGLGVGPYSLSGPTINITAHPADVNCAAVTFTVAATTSGTGSDVYTWYYNDPATQSGWSLVSTLVDVTVTGSGTSTISISGPVAVLKDYQFYCQITRGSCTQISNAAQFSYNSLPYYRTKSSGQWTDPTIWEMSTSEFGTYVTACQYPISVNSDKVTIQNSHAVTLDVIDVNIDWVSINTGATLTVTGSSLLSMNNGNAGGADLEVNGTLVDNATTTNGLSFISSTWQLGASATIIRSNTSSASVYRNNYQGGMSTIPATANWIIRYLGTDVSFTTTGGTFYPNLLFESNAGNWSPDLNSFSRFSGNTAFATVKGNLDIGGAGTGTVTVYNENNNAMPMQIWGNLIVRSGNTLTNNGNSSPTPQSGTGFEVKGNVTVNGSLVVTGTTGTSGKLALSGTNPQAVSGTGTINLQDLEINNSSTGAGGGVTLNRPLDMNGVLTLSNGLLNTTSTNILSLSANATCPAGGKLASFVNGPMRKTGSANFTFPVGKPVTATYTLNAPNAPINTGGYRPIGISSLSATETFTAEYMLENPTQWAISPNAIGAGLQGISRCEYWNLTRSGTATATVTLSWSENSLGQSQCNVGPYITSIASAVVVPWYSNQWGDQSPDYYGQTGSVAPTGPELIGTLSWDGSSGVINSYEKFVIGTINWQLAPLPFDLAVFNAVGKGKQVQLDWKVNNNQQIKEYTLERSRDGQRFEAFKSIAARLQEQQASYTDTDPAPFAGWNFYRLKAVTNEGTVYYSELRKVKMEQVPEIALSPNPARNIVTVRLPDAASVSELTISNSVGQVVRQLKPTATVLSVDVSAWPSGMYYVRFVTANGIVVKPFVKN